MDIYKLLQDVKDNSVTVEQAAESLKVLPFEDISFAKLDHHREVRTGFGEVVFCQGKTPHQVKEIFKTFALKNSNVLGTRASNEHYDAVKAEFPNAIYNIAARTIRLDVKPNKDKIGKVAICTAGTADIPVAQEAIETADFFGANAISIFDIGVAGIHRLFHHIDTLRSCNCIVAVAGMDGALPSVLAGLVDVPVIAVPTSVGYGASFGGVAALLTMLNSCAEGISVVNIDNGFGAGYLCAQINRMCNHSRTK